MYVRALQQTCYAHLTAQTATPRTTWVSSSLSRHHRVTSFTARAERINNQQNGNPRVLALERVLQDVLFEAGTGDGRGDWEEIHDAWVLAPSSGIPEGIVHFLGGAFVGVAPQLAYRQFLEALADRHLLVIATPFSTHFDHLRSADETQFKFDGAYATLLQRHPKLAALPVYGVGHSLGSLLLVLLGSKFGVRRHGNVLLSFNNKPAQEVVPLLQQVEPAARFLLPVVQQAASFRTTAEMMRDALKGLSPSLVNQLTPLAEQFLPIYYDIAQGHREFTPSPQETRHRIQSYYGDPRQLLGSFMIFGVVGIRRNLLIQFNDDDLDETEMLAAVLKEATMSMDLDLTIRSLPGDHGRPMQPTVDLPPELTRAANAAFNTGGGFLSQLSKIAADAGQSEGSARLDQFSKSVSGMADMFNSASESGLHPKVTSLADEIAIWMGISGILPQGQRYLTTRDTP